MSVAGLVAAAREAGLVLATAESCTGGLVAAAITEVPGASDVFDRGFVTYSNDAKTRMLGVAAELIKAHGAVSVEVAEAMAEGAVNASLATLAVSVTGIAGPGGSEFKPEGRVCFAVARREHTTRSEVVEFGALGRKRVREAACDYAISLLHKACGSAV